MKWEYLVVHLNFQSDDNQDNDVGNPKEASEKLKGSLSPDFIMQQFPDKYNDKDKGIHPALQISNFLNKKGEDGWELFETISLQGLFLLILKKPLT